MPRPSTLRSSARRRSNAPSPQPTSSTRDLGATSSAMRKRSTRGGAWGRAKFNRRPCARAAASMKPFVVSMSSGTSSRKASCPRSVSISTKETDAPPAFSARTVAREVARGKQPVGGEGDDAEAGSRAFEGVRQRSAIVRGEVEIVHRPRHVEIGVRIEALDEDRALVTQVGFNLKIRVEGKGARRAVLEIAPELAMQRALGEIGDVGRHARDAEALAGPRALDQIAPVPPVRIRHDRLPADLVEGDVLRGMARRGRDRKRGEDAIGIGRRPLQHLHAAHRTAGHAKQRVDAEMVDQQRLRAHHVGDRDDRKVEAVGLAGLRIERGGAGRAHAAAEDVRANDEEPVGVERPARADHRLPPARAAGDRVRIGDMLVAGQGVTEENGVGFRRVERAIGLVGDASAAPEPRPNPSAGANRSRGAASGYPAKRIA